MRGCVKRAGRDDTRELNPPRWCGALDKDSCPAHFSTTIHGEPRLCQWVDVGCRSGNMSLCAAELAATHINITRIPPVLAADTDHDGMPLPITSAPLLVATLLVAVLLMWCKGRAGSRGQHQLVATRERDGELERFADQAPPPPGGAAGTELVDFRDDDSQITFLPVQEDFRILREASDDDGSDVTFLPTGPATEYAQEQPPTQLTPPPIEEGGEFERVFTQEHAAQAASRYRLSTQLRERIEASRPPRGSSQDTNTFDDKKQRLYDKKRQDRLDDKKRQETGVAEHDFDVPTARAQETIAQVARRPVSQPNYSLD